MWTLQKTIQISNEDPATPELNSAFILQLSKQLAKILWSHRQEPRQIVLPERKPEPHRTARPQGRSPDDQPSEEALEPPGGRKRCSFNHLHHLAEVFAGQRPQNGRGKGNVLTHMSAKHPCRHPPGGRR